MSKYTIPVKITIILLLGITTTFVPRILALDSYNLQNKRYDYIDVAKKITAPRSRGRTTRIFTTNNELDEKFWLQYLGEDIRHAVNLYVDGQNNDIPVADIKPSILKYEAKSDKRTRFVRQLTHKENDNKQLPVETLVEQNNNLQTNSSEIPETFNDNLDMTTNTTTATAAPTPANNIQQQHFNSKKPSKHKYKLFQSSIYSNKKKVAQDMNKPIEIHLPLTKDSIYHIYEEYVPVIVQLPSEVYLQKAEWNPQNKLYR